MTSSSQELSKFKQDKLLRDAELIAKRQTWILVATGVVFVIAVCATILAGYALHVQSSTPDNNVLKFSSSSRLDNGQTDYGTHTNDSEVALIAQRTSDLEAKINATNVLLTNLRDKGEQMREQISSLTNELNALKNNISETNALVRQNTSLRFQPTQCTVNIAEKTKEWSTTSSTSSSSSSNKAQGYVAAVGFFVVLFMYLC